MVLFGGCLEALEHSQLNPASCCIPALLSATAPPSQSIVLSCIWCDNACLPSCTAIFHYHHNTLPTYSFFPVCLSDGLWGSPRAHFTVLAHLLGKPSLVSIGSHTQALAPSESAIGCIPKSKSSLAKSPVNMLSLHLSEPPSLGRVEFSMCRCQVSQISGSLSTVSRCASAQ